MRNHYSNKFFFFFFFFYVSFYVNIQTSSWRATSRWGVFLSRKIQQVNRWELYQLGTCKRLNFFQVFKYSNLSHILKKWKEFEQIFMLLSMLVLRLLFSMGCLFIAQCTEILRVNYWKLHRLGKNIILFKYSNRNHTLKKWNEHEEPLFEQILLLLFFLLCFFLC